MHLQAEIIRLLAATHNNVAVVGDDAQSIYSFRGANFRNIMDFPKHFPGARIIKLEENYRSTQPILNLTNEIIQRAKEGYEKRLFTRKSVGTRPKLVQAGSEQMQSQFVCQKILELREEGVPLWDIAVLFRSSFHSFDLEIELARHKIPFVKRGGFQFMEAAHVKDLLAHLRILANPQDAISWNRVLMLLEGIGPGASQKIIKWLLDGGSAVERLRSYNAKGKIAQGLRTLAQVLEEAGQAELPSEQAQYLMQYYVPILKQNYPDDHPKRLRDMEHFQGMTERYRSLERLLSDMALEPPNDSIGGVLAVDPDEGPLILSTIHSAKGLEFHSVFIIWALEGRFPSFINTTSEEELEEERRLLYVAATRAKQNLFISYPTRVFDKTLRMVLSRPSQFIDDMPHALARTGRPRAGRIVLGLGELNMVQLFHYIVVFVSGAVLMALEIAGSRVLAPHFGSSIFVWGSLISVVMTALSIGYYWGGWLSTREPSYAKLMLLLLIPGIVVFFLPFYLPVDQRVDRHA